MVDWNVHDSNIAWCETPSRKKFYPFPPTQTSRQRSWLELKLGLFCIHRDRAAFFPVNLNLLNRSEFYIKLKFNRKIFLRNHLHQVVRPKKQL